MQKPAMNSLTLQNVLVNILCTLAFTASQALAQIAENTTDAQLTRSTQASQLSQPLPPLITAPQPPCQFNPNQAPEMVLLQGGYFQMGSAQGDKHADENEMPQHWVAVQPFALSRCEITVAQFRQFVQETGYKTTAEKPENTSALASGNTGNTGSDGEDWEGEAILNETGQAKGCFSFMGGEWGANSNTHWRNPGFAQGDSDPVTCVSWWDAKAFIQWLNARTGQEYRLPSEAEWEYAARANYSGIFSFGDALDSPENCQFMNVGGDDVCSDGFYYTAPVASFQPNGFGLYDMHGNLWEWTADCWQENYNNAPVDGSARLAVSQSNDDVNGDGCERYSARGGSWYKGPQYARSANRDRSDRNYDIFSHVGFRVARTL